MKTHSKFWTQPLVLGEDDNTRVYKALRLNTINTSIEGFKLLKAVMPSLGTAVDMLTSQKEGGFDIPQTFSSIFIMLNQNLTEEQFETLTDKLFGSLMVNKEEIEDWNSHFDEHPEDFLDVWIFLFKENFYNFFMESATVRNILSKLSKNLDPKLLETLTQVLK